MTEAQIWTALLPIVQAGISVPNLYAQQAYQYSPSGAQVLAGAYLQRITAPRYGAQARRDTLNTNTGLFDHTESVWLRATYQCTVLYITDGTVTTAFDIAEQIAFHLQTDTARAQLRAAGLGIERITDIRTPFFNDDKNRNEMSPSFDFVLSYNQSRTSTVKAVYEYDATVQRV